MSPINRFLSTSFYISVEMVLDLFNSPSVTYENISIIQRLNISKIIQYWFTNLIMNRSKMFQLKTRNVIKLFDFLQEFIHFT